MNRCFWKEQKDPADVIFECVEKAKEIRRLLKNIQIEEYGCPVSEWHLRNFADTKVFRLTMELAGFHQKIKGFRKWISYRKIADLPGNATHVNGISLETLGVSPSFCAQWCEEHPEYAPTYIRDAEILEKYSD